MFSACCSSWRAGAELGQLGDAVDEVGDLGAEALLDVGQGVLGVLGDVVQERGLDGDGSSPSSARIWADGERVGDVRLARRALLAGVGLDREVERLGRPARGRPAGSARPSAVSSPRLRTSNERLLVARRPGRRGRRRVALRTVVVLVVGGSIDMGLKG